MGQISTSYTLQEGRVVQVIMSTSDYECLVNINRETPDTYTYQSRGDDDQDWVTAPTPMSLADCILAGHVFLGLIPPHNFDPIPSPNQH